MTAVAVAVPLIAAAGAYLRWAVRPVTTAYRLGSRAGRMGGGR